MAVALYAFTCGHLTLPLGFLLAGRKGRVRVPITSYLIEHPRGRVVFDSGLHAATLRDPEAHIGAGLARFHEFDYRSGEDIASRLASIDVDPASVTHVVNSHFHFDHCGGNALLPSATVVAQRREWDAARAGGTERGYVSADFETGQPTKVVESEFDVFGDGSVVCFPSYGHTPGHQSLRVRTETGGEHILCGDACYLKESLDTLQLPGVVADREAALAAFHVFRDLESAGAKILFGHDLAFWEKIPKAPARGWARSELRRRAGSRCARRRSRGSPSARGRCRGRAGWRRRGRAASSRSCGCGRSR